MYKTIIYTPNGYYASKFLWHDPGYAFKNNPVHKSWEYLGNNSDKLAQDLNIPKDYLPCWDYEYITFPLQMGLI